LYGWNRNGEKKGDLDNEKLRQVIYRTERQDGRSLAETNLWQRRGDRSLTELGRQASRRDKASDIWKKQSDISLAEAGRQNFGNDKRIEF
jgi:hypothetical protein